MSNLLQIQMRFTDFRFGFSAFITAFIVAMIVMPVLIKIIQRFSLFDVPDNRKEHASPIPTMGGIATCIGMAVACLLWFKVTDDSFHVSFFFSVAVLFLVGILDDMKNMPARRKLIVQIAVAGLISFSGIRIDNLNGLLGIHAIPIAAQYAITILAITGITNAFNLIDGIDGLAGGLGFMSLIILGLFLTFSGAPNEAVIAFALSGGLLGFLYYNFNPARIFMGDTGSLVLGFVVAVLCVKLVHVNGDTASVVTIKHAPVFALSIVAIPVFDTLRVFAIRLAQKRSPFSPDKNHVHHMLTNNGWSHGFSAKLICAVHGLVLILGYIFKDLSQMLALVILLILMLVTVVIFQRLQPIKK